MKDIIVNISIFIVYPLCMIYILSTVIGNTVISCTRTDSSPVEEMYHRQLVNTLDSILDSRFGAGCCKEDNDTVSANTFRTRFGGVLLPVD